MVPQPNSPTPAASPEEIHRRGFLTKAAAVLFGGIAGLLPVVSGALFFLNPLRLSLDPTRKPEESSGTDFIKVTDLSSLPADGQPVMFPVIADKVDAWNRFPKQAIGGVYLRKTSEGNVEALNVTCPHLGCAVAYRASDKSYFCPCHQSSFDIDGNPKNSTPPRGLDALETEVKDGAVLVKFQNFETGHSEKIPKA